MNISHCIHDYVLSEQPHWDEAERIEGIDDIIRLIEWHSIKFCRWLHATSDQPKPNRPIGGTWFDSVCVESINNLACAHNSRIYFLLCLGERVIDEIITNIDFDWLHNPNLCGETHIPLIQSRWEDGRIWGQVHLERAIHGDKKGLREAQNRFGKSVQIHALEILASLRIAQALVGN